MKKTELKNCPQWLLDADDFLGGNFLGGNFLSGNFLGGDFLGGNFLSGDWIKGTVRGITAKVILTFTVCEGYSKTLMDVEGVAWIMAGCRWFTLADAKNYWKGREDRIQTRAMLHGAVALAKYLGLKEK